jgi:NADH-quinone oxidoreductase subunit N
VIVDLSTVSLVWPEFILILIATWIYVGGTLSPGRTIWNAMAIVTYLVVFLVMLKNESVLRHDVARGLVAINGPLIIDYLGQVSRYGCLWLGLLLTLVAFRAGAERLATEVSGTIMMLVAGLMLVCRANELVFLFVALELISIPTYVLLFLGRNDRASGEATVKYFFLSILASALLLYGMSFIYGLARGTTLISGTAAVPGIRGAIEQLPGPQVSLFLIGLVMMVLGLGFKIAAVPFHFYAPDVYQGTTNINAGLLAVAPKVAGILALIRLVVAIVPADSALGWPLMWVLAILTMTLGNVCALWQQNLRRLMAYSSIAHAGYMLIGFTVALVSATAGGIGATLLYLVVYVLAALGVFAALAYLSDEQHEVSGVSELAGLARAHPWVAGALALCLFSLAGIPPLAGFWGKLALFVGAIRLALNGQGSVSIWLLVLAVAGVLNAAIAAAYYLRVISVMYFAAPGTQLTTRGGAGAMLGTIACCVLVLVLSVWPGIAIRTANLADPLLRQAPGTVAAQLRNEPAAVSAYRGDQAGQLQKGGS